MASKNFIPFDVESWTQLGQDHLHSCRDQTSDNCRQTVQCQSMSGLRGHVPEMGRMKMHRFSSTIFPLPSLPRSFQPPQIPCDTKNTSKKGRFHIGKLRRKYGIFGFPLLLQIQFAADRALPQHKKTSSDPSLRWLDTQIHKSWGNNRIHDVSWRHVSMAGRGRVPHRTLRESSAAGERQGFAGFRLSVRAPVYFAQ